jgi:NAD(P)-dependent dehydrogenase (short-subunit alcohol dehydrogenase family)
MREKRVFITGGASGLGLALATDYMARGWRVCIGDVNDERGRQAEAVLLGLGSEAWYVRCDVTQEADLQAVADQLLARWGGVDVVVNNAGVALGGPFEEVSIKDWAWIVDINLMGVVRGCRVFTSLFKRQGHGHLVNISSMAGLMDVPMMAAYNSTKAAVVTLSETLQLELESYGIGVTVVCPAFFKTNLTESFRSELPGLVSLTQRLMEKSSLSAADVARRIADAVEKGEFYVIPHLQTLWYWRLKRWLPRRVFNEMRRGQIRKLLRHRDKPEPKLT